MSVARAVAAVLERIAIVPGARLLVAASGGPDSTALLVAAAEEGPVRGVAVDAAWVNHRLRPEAAAEGEVVHALAARLGIAFHALAGDARAEARRLRTSCQDGARVLRYRLLAECAATAGGAWVATAHTADDQAETVLLRVLRGAGLPGMAAILPERALAPGVTLLRPLLGVRRADAARFLEERGLVATAVADPSNRDARYARTRVRAEVVPLLEREDPAIVTHLAALAEDARAASAFLEGMAAARLAEHGAEPAPGGGVAFPAAAIAGAPDALRAYVVRAVLARAGGEGRRLERTHVEAAVRLCAGVHGSAEVTWPGGWRLRRTYGRVDLVRVDAEAAASARSIPGTAAVAEAAAARAGAQAESLTVTGPGTVSLPWALASHAVLQLRAAAQAGGDVVRADFPLVIRPRRPGDRVRLAGRRTRRVQDLLVDARVPRADRDRLPLVCAGPDGATILFIPGIGLAAGAAPAPGAPGVHVEFGKNPPAPVP